MDIYEEPMSGIPLKSRGSLQLERIETPKGLDRRAGRGPSPETGSEEMGALGHVSRRLNSQFDAVEGQSLPVAGPTLLRSLSLTANLPALLKSVASLAEGGRIPIQTAWQDIRGYAQKQLLERLVGMADGFGDKKLPGFVYKPGSVGMCYVKPTESTQHGCPLYERLPPITIRPILDPTSQLSGLADSPATARFSEQLMSGKTVASVIPGISGEEHVIKRYLLTPKKRQRILQLHQGCLMAGEDLNALFRKAGDKGFVCFHYKLDRGPDGAGDLVLSGLSKGKASLAASNAQMVVTVKRGVGGTAGMKSEARLLDKGALLGLILGEDPESLLKYYAALSKIEDDPSAVRNLSVEDEELLEDKPLVAEKKLSLHSLCCRIDLFLDRELWTALTGREVSELMAATRRFGEHFSEKMREQNWNRHLEHLRMVRAAIVREVQDADDEVDEDRDDGPTGNKDCPTLAGKLAIHEQIDALLDEAMGCLQTKEPSEAARGQQSFLKMHVSCLALAAGHKRFNVGHASHVMPMYMVSTRDCFSSDIVGEDVSLMTATGREFVRTRWFIQSAEAPANFDAVLEGLRDNGHEDGDLQVVQSEVLNRQSSKRLDGTEGGKVVGTAEAVEAVEGQAGEPSAQRTGVDSMIRLLTDGMVSTVVTATEASRELKPDCAENYLLPLGVTTYNGLYDPQELGDIEAKCDQLHQESIKGVLPKECYHETSTKTGSLKRTKYFFGSRYLWSREQLKSPHAKLAGGIRRDVPKPPSWMKDMVEQPMVSANLADEGFVDAIALNMYHDGSEGIQSHYDDAKRFHQPIYSLRLFSDSRLSFGTQLYGFTNGLFFVPMPRGCVTVMENSGYAANGVKHCVRPIDMTGKSAAMILRKINDDALKLAEELFWKEGLRKLSSLSLEPANPEELIWNPLFDGDSTMDKETSLLLQKQRNEKRDEKLVNLLLRSMIREVVKREQRRETRKRKVVEIVSGMVKRVCTAERLGVDLCGIDDRLTVDGNRQGADGHTQAQPTQGGTLDCHETAEVLNDDTLDLFSLVDDMISFVEHPAHALKRGVHRTL